MEAPHEIGRTMTASASAHPVPARGAARPDGPRVAHPAADLRPAAPFLRRRPPRPTCRVEFLGRRAATPSARRPARTPSWPRTSSWPGSAAARHHRAQDRPGARRAGHLPALHRHGDRRLQRRVEPGAADRPVARGVRQGLDDHRDPPRLGASSRPFLGPDPGPHVFDISVGYDLAGISSEPGGRLHRRARRRRRRRSSGSRPEIPEPFAAWRDHPFPTRVAGSVTLSTFHGCPPDEIEAIARHLMTPAWPRRRRQAQPDPARVRAGSARSWRRARLRGGPAPPRRPSTPTSSSPAGVELIGELDCVRPGPRAAVRRQAHQHPRGREPQGLPARRPDVPVGPAAPRARHRPCSTSSTGAPGGSRSVGRTARSR